MKLLMVSAYFDTHRGGVEIVCGELCRALVKHGESVTWAASAVDGLEDNREGMTHSPRLLPMSACNFLERRLGIPWPVWGITSVICLKREIVSVDIVVIHDSLYYGSIVAYFLARCMDKPVVLIQHIGMVPYRNRVVHAAMWLGERVLGRKLASRADQVVFISETTRAHFKGLCFKRPPITCFNGVDANVFQPLFDPVARARLRHGLGLLPERSNVAFVGRFVEKKGLTVIRRLAEMMPEVNWLLAGWGSENPRNWGLPNVHIFGGRQGTGIAEIYQAADLLVLPSVGEGFPLVIQEAMACGTPVICATDTAEADPFIRGHLFTAAVDLGDIELTASEWKSAIQSALHAVSSGRVDARELAVVARARYAWEAAGRQYREIFAELVSPRGANA